MSKFKNQKLIISILFGLLLFVLTYPFYHDMYIAEVHTFICILLNAISSLIFSLFLYKELTKSINNENRIIFLWFIILQSIGHSIFAFMNWGSFLFLALSLIAIILLVISYINEKKEN